MIPFRLVVAPETIMQMGQGENVGYIGGKGALLGIVWIGGEWTEVWGTLGRITVKRVAECQCWLGESSKVHVSPRKASALWFGHFSWEPKYSHMLLITGDVF